MTAGTGIIVTGTGTRADPYVVSGSGGGGAISTGCGLAGDGSPGTPLAVAPAAGQEPWPWTTCTAAAGSTLKCDPDTAQLWTPPEHDSLIDVGPQFDFINPPGPIGPTGGPMSLEGGPASIFWGAGNFGDCRQWSGNYAWIGTADVAYTADAEFRIGYLISNDGGPQQFRPIGGVLNTPGAGRLLINGTVIGWTGVLQPNQGFISAGARAIDVVSGQVIIASWLVDRQRTSATRAAPV